MIYEWIVIYDDGTVERFEGKGIWDFGKDLKTDFPISIIRKGIIY